MGESPLLMIQTVINLYCVFGIVIGILTKRPSGIRDIEYLSINKGLKKGLIIPEYL